MSDDRHRCQARSLCRASVVEDGRKMPALTESPDTLCASCTRSVRAAVEDLPRDYVALHGALGERGTAAGQRVRSTPTPPIPLNVSVEAAMRDISETLDRAAELVSDALRCDPPSGPEAKRVDLCSRMVTPHIDKLVAADAEAVFRWDKAGEKQHLAERSGVQFALDLQQLHRHARSLIGETEKLIRLPMPCGRCGAPFVFQKPDSDAVFCRECHADFTEELYAFAGRLSRQREEEMELKERTEVWLEAEKLYLRAVAAEERADRLQRGFEAALNPDFADIPAGQFAQIVLQEAS